MNINTSLTGNGQSPADTIAAIQSLVGEGKSTRQISEILGIPPLSVTRIRKKYRTASEFTPAVEPSAPATQPSKTSKPKPTEAEVRERVATDELSVPFSNWLGNGWYREAGKNQDIYETDQEGNSNSLERRSILVSSGRSRGMARRR